MSSSAISCRLQALFRGILRIPKVLFTHNVEAVIWRRHYEVATNPVWKAISWWEWRKMEAAEQRYLRLADRVLTVSETDRDALATFLDPQKITVIPTGVDVDYFQPMPMEEVPDSLVFTGSMDWLPNEDAIFHFVEAILPLIKQQHPRCLSKSWAEILPANCKLCSRQKSRCVSRAGSRTFGPSWRAARFVLFLCALAAARGSRFSRLWPWARRLFLQRWARRVCRCRPGKTFFWPTRPNDFAASVISLLRDSSQRRRLGIAARRLVHENYSWPKVAESFSRVLQDVLSP